MGRSEAGKFGFKGVAPVGHAQEKIRILVADEEALFRRAVGMALEAEGDMTIVAHAADAREALTQAIATQPHLALVASTLPSSDGVNVLRTLAERCPQTNILVLSSQDDHDLLVSAVRAGVSGYLSKQAPLAELIDAVRAVHQGEAAIPRRMLKHLLGQLVHGNDARNRARKKLNELTRQEKCVLALLVEGTTSAGIASQLTISPHTARTHVQRLLKKLDAHSRLEAVALVRHAGLEEELNQVTA